MRVIIQRFRKTDKEEIERFERSFPDDKKGEKQLERWCKFFKNDHQQKGKHEYSKLSVTFQQEQARISFPS